MSEQTTTPAAAPAPAAPASGGSSNEIRYLTPISIETTKEKYCRFKKMGITYIDYKDADFLLRFVNEQGKILPRRLTGTSLKFQKKSTGFYHLIEFDAEASFVAKLETEYRRDERIIRFLTVAMDTHHRAFAEKRRNTAKKENAEPANA